MFKTCVVMALVAATALAGSVVVLDGNNFDSIVLDKSKDVFVKFYAPWCGHCQRMVGTWNELAEKNDNDDVVIAKVDADAHREVGSKFGVRGFPTLKWFSKSDKSGKDYQGGRDLASFQNFVKANQS